MTQKRRAEQTINKPADEVWGRVRDFGDISWIPNTEACEFDGKVRKVSRAAWDFKLQQRLTNFSDEDRTLGLRPPRAARLLGVLRARPHGEHHHRLPEGERPGRLDVVRHLGHRDRGLHDRGRARRVPGVARPAQGNSRRISSERRRRSARSPGRTQSSSARISAVCSPTSGARVIESGICSPLNGSPG